MRVGALPSKPSKGTQGYQGGAHARRVLSVPLRRQENVEPQARFHRHLQFIHHRGHGTSLTAASADLARPRRESRKLPLALENRQYLEGRRGDAKVPGCNGANDRLLTIVTSVPISGTIATMGPEACAPIARP